MGFQKELDMKTVARLLILILMLLLGVWCLGDCAGRIKETIQRRVVGLLSKDKDKNGTAEVEGAPGRWVSKEILMTEGKRDSILRVLLAEEREWDGAMVTYAPGVLLLSFDGMSINFHDDMVILNVQTGAGPKSKWQQYVSPCTADERDRLKGELGLGG